MKPCSLITSTIIFLLSVLINLQCTQSNSTPTTCTSFSCNPDQNDTIQFPFRVPRNQTKRCGYPGFELSCKNDQTFLKLPSNPSNPFLVGAIDYPDQLIWLSDPNRCLPKQVMDLNLTGSPYIPSGAVVTQYSFLNCTRPVNGSDEYPVGSSVISCMSGSNFTVMATFEKGSEEELEREGKCELMKRVELSLWWPGFDIGYYPDDMSNVFIQLSWDGPGCGDCVVQGGSCGFASDSGFDVACFISGTNGGLSKGAKIGLTLGVGVPGLLCIIALTFYISSKAKVRNHNGRHANIESSPAIFPQPVMIPLGGLEMSTIESYPKTILGESKRLPKTSDGTCPICLSEYQPKETLRSIPECNHYFHANCIDEWLRMNATCPLCRNLPNKS